MFLVKRVMTLRVGEELSGFEMLSQKKTFLWTSVDGLAWFMVVFHGEQYSKLAIILVWLVVSYDRNISVIGDWLILDTSLQS